MSSFRDRLYRAYVRGQDDSYAPRELSQLESGEHYRRRLIARHFPERRDAAILDLGCGHGNLLHLAHQAGYSRAWGVDRSPEQVQEAARLGIAGVREGDLLETMAAQPDRSLEAMIAFDVLEHLTRDELLDVADHAARVLAPGGRFLLHVPNGGAPFGGQILWGDLTHERAFTPQSLAQLLRPAGFASVACY